jgi:hypothetical protein
MNQRIQLPAPQTPPLPAIDVSPVLEGVTYTLHLQWNTRDSGWRLRVLDEPGQTVLMGDTRLVADWPLYRSRIERTPPGLFLVRDTSGAGEDPTLDGLGGRWQLWYIPAADLAALGV